MELTKNQKRLLELTESVLFEHPTRGCNPEQKASEDALESIKSYLRKLQKQENSIKVY